MSESPADPPEDAAAARAEPASPADACARGPGTEGPISSETLLGGRSQLAIRHRQTTYFLRQTRFGKLILTK